MITMEMIGKVRRMKLREQLSNSEIARRTGLSRNTVKKWLQAPGDQAPKYQRGNSPTKLGAFEATLVQALEADARRPKHARRTARALFAQLQAQGYRGGYSRLTDFIRYWQMNAATDAEYLPLAQRIAADEHVVLSDAQLLSAIAGNNGSFRSVIFSVLRLAKRTASQSATAASIAAATIQQAAAKK